MSRQLTLESVPRASTSSYAKKVGLGLVGGIISSILVAAGVWALSAAFPTKPDGTPVPAIIDWLYHTSGSVGIRESLWVFPIVEGTHLLGIALSAGALCWFDLRLLGLAMTDERISRVWKYVMPVAFVGFGLVFLTGFLLFWAEAATAYRSPHFWIKMVLIALAGINAMYFETKLHPKMSEWDTHVTPPFPARVAGILSLILWTAIIVTGRTMAYTF